MELKIPNWNSLEDKIIRPGIEEKLLPLVLYRGSASLGRIHRLWNVAIAMMEHEVENYSQGIKFSHNPDFAHLCGPRRPLDYSVFPSLFGKLRDHPNVTNNIPGLTQYVRDINGMKWHLTKIKLFTKYQGVKHMARLAPYRMTRIRTKLPDGPVTKNGETLFVKDGHLEISLYDLVCNPTWDQSEFIRLHRKQRPRTIKPKVVREKTVADLFYPYIVHNPARKKEGEDLVMAVNSAVPAYWPDWLRADVCQDLVVAILSGELSQDELHPQNVQKFSRAVFKMHPLKYGPLSLDAPFSLDNSMTLADIISDGSFERMQEKDRESQ